MDDAGGHLESRFRSVLEDWTSLTWHRASVDEERFSMAAAEARAIVEAGQWVSGPEDLLTIIGRQRFELFHSRLLAWLMAPTGRHGMGTAFLRLLLHKLWPEETRPILGPVLVELEVTRIGSSDLSGDPLAARADIVVHTDDLVLVIENKVDAGEQPDQCERLYWAWRDSPTETRWIYLTLTGRPPTTAISGEAQSAWRAMSYRQVAKALEAALSETERGTQPAGRASAHQYLATVRSQIGG